MSDIDRSILKPADVRQPVTDASRRNLLRVGAGLSMGLGAATVLGTSPAWSQQQGYRTLDVPVPTRSADQVEVLEFFWFGCPHCFAFEPAINAWAASRPEYTSFVREAPPLNPGWEQHSRAFYAAEALGITEGFFDAMFNAIHQDRQPLRDAGKIASFVESLDLGVDADKFASAMKSFSVESALRRSSQLARDAGITGVPSVLINGKYMTGSSLAGGHDGIIRVINTLAAEEHAAS